MEAEYADCEHCEKRIMRFPGGAWEHVDDPDSDWLHFASPILDPLTEEDAEAELGRQWFTHAPLSVPTYAHKPIESVDTRGYL